MQASPWYSLSFILPYITLIDKIHCPWPNSFPAWGNPSGVHSYNMVRIESPSFLASLWFFKVLGGFITPIGYAIIAWTSRLGDGWKDMCVVHAQCLLNFVVLVLLVSRLWGSSQRSRWHHGEVLCPESADTWTVSRTKWVSLACVSNGLFLLDNMPHSGKFRQVKSLAAS